MGKRKRYLDHVDPEYRRWGRTYQAFPGVDECARLIVDGKATGAWADIVHDELADNAEEHLDEMIDAFQEHQADDVAIRILAALETAAVPGSVAFWSGILHRGDPRFTSYAKQALAAIDTKESRSALFHAPEE